MRTATIPVEQRTRHPEEETVSLIKQYRHSRDTAILEEIVNKNIGLVKSIALKYAHGESIDDLIQSGYIGLINAVNNFDLQSKNHFSTYATYLISGEILHFLRGSRLIKSPRWIRAISAQVNRSVEELTKKLGGLPKISEIAQEANITEEGVLEVLKFRNTYHIVSLDQLKDEGTEIDDCPDVEKVRSSGYRSFELPVEDKIRVYQAMDRLSDLEKKIIFYVFYKDLTETEIGQRLKVEQRKVSRILHRSLGRLKEILGQEA
ncbi:MAG: sigma-70 family RNA polymerase sigma factor [Actinomycetota bacterium]